MRREGVLGISSTKQQWGTLKDTYGIFLAKKLSLIHHTIRKANGFIAFLIIVSSLSLPYFFLCCPLLEFLCTMVSIFSGVVRVHSVLILH